MPGGGPIIICFLSVLSPYPSLKNPDVAKAKLISRMAKMGQPMLPFLAGTAPAQLDSSDSEIEVCLLLPLLAIVSLSRFKPCSSGIPNRIVVPNRGPFATHVELKTKPVGAPGGEGHSIQLEFSEFIFGANV